MDQTPQKDGEEEAAWYWVAREKTNISLSVQAGENKTDRSSGVPIILS
jgi:hypothetical protein